MTKIVLTGPDLPPSVMERARSEGAIIIPTGTILSAAELTALMAHEQPDAIIVRLGGLDQQAIEASAQLQIVAKHGVGYDSIDVATATGRGVPVTVTDGASAQSVAEHTLALVLCVARRIPWLDSRVRSGHWDKTRTTGIEIAGKTVGIVGAGSIGRTFARLISAWDVRVLAYDPFVSLDLVGDRLEMVAGLDELLERSDIVSLHCPLTPRTRRIIGGAQFQRMRHDAILINTARGDLIDVAALTDALEHNRIFGAGLDTFTVEPAPTHSRLWALPHLVITPHVGAVTREASERVGMTAVNQVLEWIASRRVSTGRIINPEFDRVTTAPADR